MKNDNYFPTSPDSTMGKHPAEGERWIYFVAGIRNIESANALRGLWANIGQTDRSVEERLDDNDYSKKAGGGMWVILNKWLVPNWVDDSEIHKILRITDNVIWRDSQNTEEFFFPLDLGDGVIASAIIESSISRCIIAASRRQKAAINLTAEKKPEITPELSDAKDSKETLESSVQPRNTSDWRETYKMHSLWRERTLTEIELVRTSFGFKSPAVFLIIFYSIVVMLQIFCRLFDPTLFQMIFIVAPIISLVTLITPYLLIKKRFNSLLDSLIKNI